MSSSHSCRGRNFRPQTAVSPNGMRRLKWGGVIVLALAGLVVLGWVVYSRAAFGTWNPLALPSRIDYCDRRYYPGWHFTRTQIDARGNDLGIFPFRRVA